MSLTNGRDREPPPPATLFGHPVSLNVELEPGVVILVSGADALVLGADGATLNVERILDAIREARMGMARGDVPVRLELDGDEALATHHALSMAVQLLDEVTDVPPHAPLYGKRGQLARIARRLDHERRHRGAVPNPNGPDR